MTKSWQKRLRRREEVKRRAAESSTFFKNCRVIGCKEPARAATQDGLDTRFCRRHADQYARHGSPYRKSYKASELNPYRRTALDWLVTHERDRLVVNAIQRVQGLYDRAGPHIEAFRLRGLTPRERANVAWARLRYRKIDPRVVVATWLAVEMKTKDDPQADTKSEYKRVQAAKVIHRLASGTHKRWSAQGNGKTVELHVFPASRGNVLRYIGEDLERAVELLAEHALKDLLTFMNERKRWPRAAVVRPHPRKLRPRASHDAPEA